MMKTALRRLLQRLDALSLRERAIVCAGGLMVIGVLAYVVALEPALQQRARAQQQALVQSQLLTAVRAQQGDALRQLQADPDEPVRRRLLESQAQLQRVDAQLDGLQRELLKPDAMAPVLHKLLGSEGKVKLVSLKNLPPTLLGAEDTGKTARPGKARVYRHGIEIVVEGSYADLVGYLQRLEQQPWHLYWDRTVMTAEYPRSTLTLTLFTLSLDEIWLVV